MTRDSNLPLPDDDPELLEQIRRTVADARWRAQRVVYTELIGMYWRIGRVILDRLATEAARDTVLNQAGSPIESSRLLISALCPARLSTGRAGTSPPGRGRIP